MTLTLAACALPSAAWAGSLGEPPAPLELDEAQEAQLAEREVVLDVGQAEDGLETVAIVDVAALPTRVFEAVLDLPARVAEVDSIRAAEIYVATPATSDAPERIGGRWELGVMGRTVIFHTLYEVDRDHTYTQYLLDPDREQDLKYVRGSYQVYAHGEGSRLIYRSVTDTGYAVPGWIRRWLTSGSLKEQMVGIRTRAEAG